MSRVYIERVGTPDSLATAIERAMAWTNAAAFIRPDTRVFVKPNLTWKRHIPGVTVTPSFLEAFVTSLLQLTRHITIGESEGGQSCFQAEDAFESHGLYELQDRYSIRVVNLSKEPSRSATTDVAGREVTVRLPCVLTEETDVFITLPVPKIHAMTGVSLGLKNQWGCLGSSMRVTSHPRFDHTIVAINKLLKPRLCVFDGTFFLDRTGPMIGEAVPMQMVIAGDNVYGASDVCCRIMNVEPMSIDHHVVAAADGLWPSPDAIETNEVIEPFATHRFRLERSPVNYVQLAAFRNRPLNRLFYDSVAADWLHNVLWRVRKNPLVREALYGRYGPGEANRGGKDM